VGSQWIQELGAKDRDQMEARVTEALRASFKPEFLNRIDETIIFHNLTEDQIGNIVNIQMQRVIQRLAAMKIDLSLTDAAVALLAQKGYDPAYGARPLKRAIQQYIENPLSMEILKGRIGSGARLVADVAGDSLRFNRK
jgi:ATP-dependent Clp protease ATP-binding subunit ClpB